MSNFFVDIGVQRPNTPLSSIRFLPMLYDARPLLGDNSNLRT